MSIDWDSEIKAPQEAIFDLPQERITGDILRGRGPRRGNLERLIKYWRPIMRKPGGFRRCLVILADHPELYPLERICAWLHHETTGLWPNEGNHHEGGKLGPIVGRARRYLKKPKKRKRRGKKSLDGAEFTNYEYGFKDMVSHSRTFDGLLVQPINGRQNVLELKAAMFADRYKEVSDRKEDIEFKKVGIFGSGSAAGQAIQAAGSILMPGDLSDFRSPIRSQIYETLTPGGGRGLGLRRVVRGTGRGARNKYRCPPGFQKGGTFTNKYYSTCGAQILGIPPFGPGAFATGIERALARLARDRNLVRSIGDLKNNSNPYAVIRAAQIPFAPKKTSPTRRQTSVDLVLARIANGENVPTRFVRRDGVILEPMVSMEELGKLDEFDDMVDGSLITRYTEGILGEGSLTTFGTGLRDNYINIEDQGVVKVSRVGGELDQGTRNNTVRAFNASVAKSSGTRNPDRTAPLMDFIEASDGKFTVEFGEIKNNAFVPDNTAKNELVQVRSGNVVKLVPKWVYDTFLSRSAPRRLEADPIYELIEDSEKSLSPFFNAHKTNKQDIGLARDYYNLVNEKAARFAGLVDQAEMDVKAPRLGRALRRGGRSGGGRALRGTASAIFDNALGRWRCPPGTRRGGTFSDRLGSNCGYSLPANVVDNLGKATNAISKLGRARRKGERRREKANRVSNRLKSFNEKFDGVLGITESRVGSRLGRSIGQRRSVAKLDESQERIFSGQSVRDTMLGLQNEIEDVIQNGDKRDVEKVWEQLSKLANLEAGRLTDNTSQDSRVVRAGGQIQDLLDGFAKQIIDRPSGRQVRRRAADTRTPDERITDRRTQFQERSRQMQAERREKLGRLARNLVRGRSMRRTGQNIPDINKDRFYKDDGTLDEEFLTARRTDVANVAKSAKKRLQSVLGNRTRDDDKLDEQAVEYLKNTEVTDENVKEVASVIGSLNTFREMRDLIADDDARFAVQFEDAVRRINDIDANELLGGADSMTIRQSGDSFPTPEGTDIDDVRNFRRSVQIGQTDRSDTDLKSRFGPTNVTQSIKQAAKDKRKAIRDRIDKRAYKQYVDGETINQQLQDTLLENPNLPESVDAIASVSWEDHARLLALRDQQKLDLYTQLSDTLGPDEIEEFYEAHGLLVVPSPNWDFTAGGTLDPKETRANFISSLEEIESEGGNIRDSAKSWINHAFGTDPETGKVYPFKVGEVDVLDEQGNRIKAIKEISVDITDDDIFTTFGGSDKIAVSVPLTFTLRNSEDGSIIYQERDKGMSWSEGLLVFELDYKNGSATFSNAGTTHQIFQQRPFSASRETLIPRPDDLINPDDRRLSVDGKYYRFADPTQEVTFNSGGFMNTLSQRAMPFMKGSGLERLQIGGTAYTGSATWAKYGFATPNTSSRVELHRQSLDEIIKDAERGLEAAANGTDIDVRSATALTLIGTPEKLEEVKLLRDASNPDRPEASPDGYAIFSVFNGLEPDGRLKRNTALYRAMTGDSSVRSDKDIQAVDSQIDEAQAAFGVTFTPAERPLITNFEGNRYGFSGLASDDLSYDINNLKINPTSTITGEVDATETAMELGDIVSRLTDDPEVDAYGKRLSSLGKRHAALLSEEEKARYAASIERSLNKLVRDGVLSEDDPESRNLVNLAAELRKSVDFPEESLATSGDVFDNIATDLGDEATIAGLIDDIDFLREETDDIEFDRLKAVLQSSLEAPSGRSASKELTNPKKDPVPNFFQKHAEKFKGRKFRTNFFNNDDESEKNQQIAGQLTIFDELAEQADTRNEVARRGIDSIMEQVEEIADREGISPEEVVERAAAASLQGFLDENPDADDPITNMLRRRVGSGPAASRRGRAGGPPASRREGPPPVAEITFNQGRIQDMRLMNNTLKTLLVGQINRGDSDDFNIFNEPTILEDGTLVARLNADGSFITKDQAQRMLAAVIAFDDRVNEAFDFFQDRSTPVPFVLAETEEELDQLIRAFSLQSNVPGDDYLMLRLGNMVGLFEEAKARRNRPEGRNMLTTGSLGASPPMSRMDAAPNRRSIDNWVSTGGLPDNSELDEQIWNLSTQEGLSDREIAQRLDVSRAEVTDRRISYRAALGASDVEAAEATQETVSNARRVDAYDADLDEIAEEANTVRAAGLPEGFDLSQLIEETTPRPDVDVPDGDGDDAEIPAVNTNDVPMESLDDILTSLERRADRLQAALERLERNQFSGSGGRGRGRGGPAGGLPFPEDESVRPFGRPRKPFNEMTTSELIDAVNPPRQGMDIPGEERVDEEALAALRRRLRNLSDEELQELYNGFLGMPDDPRSPTFSSNPASQAVIEAARRRRLRRDPANPVLEDLINRPDYNQPIRDDRIMGGPAASLPRRQSTRDRDLAIDRARRQAFGASKPPQNPDPDDTNFQKEVWRLRTEEGYTLEQAGELLGVDRGVIRQAEVNYARSLRPEDREAANIRAQQAAIGRERAAAEADRLAVNKNNLETYGDKVWELRTERGYTLEETARELGIDRGTVRRVEVDYGAALTPEQKERDYARGRAAAEIRQAVDTDGGPAASRRRRRERSGPPRRQTDRRRSRFVEESERLDDRAEGRRSRFAPPPSDDFDSYYDNFDFEEYAAAVLRGDYDDGPPDIGGSRFLEDPTPPPPGTSPLPERREATFRQRLANLVRGRELFGSRRRRRRSQEAAPAPQTREERLRELGFSTDPEYIPDVGSLSYNDRLRALSAGWRNVNEHGNHPNRNSSREDWLPGTEWYTDDGPLLPTPVIFSRWVEDANIREEGTRDALGLSNAVFGDESTPLIKKSGFDKRKNDLSLRNRKDVENNLSRFSDSDLENYLVALEWNVPDEGEKGSAFSLLMPNDPLNMDRKEYTEHLDFVRMALQNRNQFRQAGTDGDSRYRRERIERFLEPWNEFGGGKMGDVWKRDLELSGDTVDERGNIVRGRFPERQRSTTLTSIERFRGEYEYPNFRERFYPRTEDVERAERRKAARRQREREIEERLNRNREYVARYGSPSERPDFFPEPGGPPEGGPPASRSGPRRAAGPPSAGGPPSPNPPEDPDDVDVFNAVHGGMDAPEGMGERRVADAIQRHLNSMSKDEREKLLNTTSSDSRIFDHPDRDLIREDQLGGMGLPEIERKYGVSPEYVVRMNQAIRERGVNRPENVPSSDAVTAPLAPAQSGFRRLVDEVRVKLGRKARKDPEGKQIVQKLGNEGLRDLKGNKGFAKKFADEGFELHVVGGAVRDIVLGKKPKDFDLATNATPEEIARVLGFEMQEDGSFVRVQQRVKGKLEMTGDAFPVLRYTTGAGNEYEIATYRADLPEGGASIEGVSLREDVGRRDLTINGMAYDLATDEIVDHVGGLADLGASIDENGNLVRDLSHVPVIRAIGDPAERLGEDPVRAIRAIRFAANTGGTLDPDTLQAIKSIDIENIPNERIRTELIKGLTSAPNTEALFKQLDESGLLQKMFPDLDLNPDEMNVKNLGSTNTAVHLAALLRGNDPEKVRSALSNLKYTNKEINGVLALHELAEVTPENAPSTLKKLRSLVRPEGDGAPTLTRRDLMNYGEVHDIDPVIVGAMIDLIDDEPITFDSLGVDIPEGPGRSLAVNTAISARFEELLEANSGNSYIKRNTELDELINRTLEGGGTFNLSRASNVTSGFAVSRNKKGVKFKRDDIVDENGEPTDEGRKLFYSFIANHLAEFGDDDRDGVTVSLGTWYDEENGDFYLDITDVFDSSKFTEADAIAMGKEQNQISIANLDAINDGETDGDILFPSAGGDGSELLPMTELARFFPEYEASKATINRDAGSDADIPEGPKVYPSGVELTETSDSDLVNLAREVANGDYGDENVDERLENLAQIARRRGQSAQEANLNLFNEIDEIRKNRGVDAPAADAPDADVTPDVDTTPDVAAPINVIEAQGMSPDDLEAAVDDIFDNLKFNEDGDKFVTAMSLSDLKAIQEKLPEDRRQAFKDRYESRIIAQIDPEGELDGVERTRAISAALRQSENKVPVNFSDDIAEGAEDAAQAATPTTRVEKLQAAKAQLEAMPGVGENPIPVKGNRTRVVYTENLKPGKHAVVFEGYGENGEDIAKVVERHSWDADSTLDEDGPLPKNIEPRLYDSAGNDIGPNPDLPYGYVVYEDGSDSEEFGRMNNRIITIPKEIQDARANLTKINLELASADPENTNMNQDPENFISDAEVDQLLEGTLEGAAEGLRDARRRSIDNT